ncbi:hypothetical protein DFH08DRAFT_963250 [Mycena albidolilacea]|uniref:Uncharacterized protein n=1 Tax=Mycena albidolilacea TaxID=1033008 RepID=A0AAD6ZVS4_9AGAR|nr:hypothetical protein DFH08DRAFT_963250 [Mycena albidolilacea]
MQLRGRYSHLFLFAQPDDAKRSLGASFCFPPVHQALMSSPASSSSYPSSAQTIPSPRTRTPMPTASYQRAKSPHLSGCAPPTSEVLAVCEAEMLLLDWLLGEWFKLGHQNLLFSRFTTRLDIIEDRAVDMKGWRICHIDETTLPRPDERLPEPPNVPRLLRLRCSARAAAASALMHTERLIDDSSRSTERPGLGPRARDWADEAKPVLIFRPIGTHTVEEKQATEKLEALVIEKGTGKFKTRGRAGRCAPHDDTSRRREHLKRRGLQALLCLRRSSRRRMRVAEVMGEEVEE